MGFDLPADYKQVPERIADLKAKHPEATLQPADPANPYHVMTVGGREFVVYTAACYRTPDDTRPGIGIAWEPFPGKTPYTKDSELMNAETSAWGRAIVAALASESKAVASAEDVRNRQADAAAPKAKARPSSPPASTRRPPPTHNTGPTCSVCHKALGTEAARKVNGQFAHVTCSGSPPAAPTSAAGDGDGVERASAPSSPNGDAGGGTAAAAGAPPMSDPQRRRLMALCNERGLSERQARLDWAADTLERPVDSFGELSRDDAAALMEALEAAPVAPTLLGVDG